MRPTRVIIWLRTICGNADRLARIYYREWIGKGKAAMGESSHLSDIAILRQPSL
jgi:hypothetical protein